MKGLPLVLLFTAMTFLAWGSYGPTLHHGAIAFDHDSMRAFVGVGLAYFLIAVLIPLSILKKSTEKGRWTVGGTIFSLIAGGVGAVGALGIILALGYGGRTVYVMPLVFGFAPVVNTLVTAAMTRSFGQIKPIFIGGVVAAALGAAGVLYFKPVPKISPAAASELNEETTAAGREPSLFSPGNFTPVRFTTALPQTDGSSAKAEAAEGSGSGGESSAITGEDEAAGGYSANDDATSDDGQGIAEAAEGGSDAEDANGNVDEGGKAKDSAEADENGTNVPGIVASIIVAAMCWGSYGPMLHIGQGKMDGSRMRPFACVGFSYFIIAVLVPLALIYSRSSDAGSWNVQGMAWSIAAGTAGAIGALGVVLAFNAGGKPYYVMPLIFGFAPVINTFISLTEAGTWGQVKPMFWISLAVVIAGAVTVLTNAPKPKGGKNQAKAKVQ